MTIQDFPLSLLTLDAILHFVLVGLVLALLIIRDRRVMRKRRDLMSLVDKVSDIMSSLREENKELRRLLNEASSSQKPEP